MARFYTEISKKEFLTKVKNLMFDDEENDNGYPWEMPQAIEKDLSKVNFDWENFTSFDTKEGFANYPVGYREIARGFHIFFAQAGGDWEFPVCFIFYWETGKLRAYIPKDGNVWNAKTKSAYGNDDRINREDQYKFMKIINEDKMIIEILKHITQK